MPPPSDRSRLVNAPSLGTLYLWVVGAIGIALLGYIARVGQPFSSGLGLVAEFVILAAVAQHFPLEFGPQRKTDASIAVYFASILLFDAGAAVLLTSLSQLVGQATLALRRAPDSGKRLRGARGVLFNTSQLVVATGLSSVVYGHLLPHAGPALQDPQNLWAVPAAAVVLHAANSLSVALMAALQLRQSVLQTWLSKWRTRAVESAGLLLVGLVAALAAGQHPWAPALLAMPAGMLFLAQRRALGLLTSEQSARADAVRAQEQLAFIARASAALASSLDYDATMECAVRLAVPELADCSAIRINREANPRQNWAVAATDRDEEERLRQLLLHGCSVRELAPTSALVVPLIARDQTLGTITFLATVSGRHYGAPEQAMAEELARPIALAIDNALLYEDQQRTVVRLQQLRGQIEANERGKLLGDERERIARELHDRVEQTFFSIGLSISVMLAAPQTTPVASLHEALMQLRSSAKQGAEELRAAIFALTRTETYDRGLVRALWQLVRDFQERTALEADLVESGVEWHAPEELAEVLYAVAREGLANAEQHAHASAVVVSLRFEPNFVALSVQDDGVGASPLVLSTLSESATRFGLRGVRERVLQLGGEFTAQAGEDGGFVVRAHVPAQRS